MRLLVGNFSRSDEARDFTHRRDHYTHLYLSGFQGLHRLTGAPQCDELRVRVVRLVEIVRPTVHKKIQWLTECFIQFVSPGDFLWSVKVVILVNPPARHFPVKICGWAKLSRSFNHIELRTSTYQHCGWSTTSRERTGDRSVCLVHSKHTWLEIATAQPGQQPACGEAGPCVKERGP